nr:MAG TPA: hypothetical protein [Caudoviricetes sp.]
MPWSIFPPLPLVLARSSATPNHPPLLALGAPVGMVWGSAHASAPRSARTTTNVKVVFYTTVFPLF